LTRSTSAATVQGYEWLSDKPFNTRLDEYNALQMCVNKNVSCVEDWSSMAGHLFEYVLVTQDSPLSAAFSSSLRYQTAYHKDHIFIFERVP
jgi:hypothetical protein